MSKSVVCIAYDFPPTTATGTHRTRGVVRHLPNFDWRPVVVTTQQNATESDPALLEGLPRDLAVYRLPAPKLLDLANRLLSPLKGCLLSQSEKGSQPPSSDRADSDTGLRPSFFDRASWWLQVPDLMIGWLPVGLAAVLHAVKRHKAIALYSSAPYWTTHLIGLIAKRMTGLPWIADFRDPWRANPFRKIPNPSADQFDAMLEQKVVTSANWVICNTDFVRQDFIGRFPDFGSKFVTIPNGFDPEDFFDLKPQRPVGCDRLVISHAGEFYGPRRPHSIFWALRLLQDQGRLKQPPCLQLLGSPVYNGQTLESIATDLGVRNSVIVVGRVPHRRGLEALSGSDVQLLVGFSGQGSELQAPAKLFEYLGVGQPILALAPRHSAIAEFVSQGSMCSEICDPENSEDIAEAIIRLDAAISRSRQNASGREGSINTQFHRKEQVGRLAQLLDSTIDKS